MSCVDNPYSVSLSTKARGKNRESNQEEMSDDTKTATEGGVVDQQEEDVPTTMVGILKKLGGGPLTSLQDRFFLLQGTSLKYHACKTQDQCNAGNYKGSIDVLGAKVIDRGTYKKCPCFTVEGENLAKGVKEYFLFAESKEAKWQWMGAIMTATTRYDFLNAGQGTNLERLASSPLFGLISGDKSNQICADCDNVQPTWTVMASDAHCAFV
jgi:hypothetical protein